MPRQARVVFPNIPHHIIQRGNRREDVFFSDNDRKQYLEWLKEYCKEQKVEILAYCLMTNHIHLIAVPTTEDGLQKVLKPLHMRYAQKINRERGWKGHFWQGRYFSSPLDGEYLLFTTRYIERNPIRVKKVRKAENYKWSSARGHCGTAQDDILTTKMKWLNKYEGIDNWSQWLSIKEEKEKTDLIRRNTEKGIPTGSGRFIRRLEKLAGRVLEYRPIGRPRKQN
ncbi:MAG: transposase [Candidatus Dadabacteria bacterium]|nr:transposase [Candidatus Dadabacteria bacterium]